jgi:hypothetical protein
MAFLWTFVSLSCPSFALLVALSKDRFKRLIAFETALHTICSLSTSPSLPCPALFLTFYVHCTLPSQLVAPNYSSAVHLIAIPSVCCVCHLLLDYIRLERATSNQARGTICGRPCATFSRSTWSRFLVSFRSPSLVRKETPRSTDPPFRLHLLNCPQSKRHASSPFSAL